MIVALAITMLAPFQVGGEVELRGQREPIDGAIVTMGVDGVEVEGRGLIGWDQVRDIEGERAEAFETDFRGYADKAWRARIRLSRGDAIGAEPLFEELFQTYAWRRGPTAAVVCEGLLRTRLRRNAQASAIAPWLSLLHAGATDTWGTGLVDPTTRLVASLPPIWLPGPAIDELRINIPAADASIDSDVREIARWYELAASFEAGRPTEIPDPVSSDRGVRLLADIVQARAGDETTRRRSRDALMVRAEATRGTWIEAWCRAAIGRSLLREADEEQIRLGIVSLLTVPALFEEELPHLAALCLAEAAASLDLDLGMHDDALRVARELASRFPGHEALGWAPMRELLSADRGVRTITRSDS